MHSTPSWTTLIVLATLAAFRASIVRKTSPSLSSTIRMRMGLAFMRSPPPEG